MGNKRQSSNLNWWRKSNGFSQLIVKQFKKLKIFSWIRQIRVEWLLVRRGCCLHFLIWNFISLCKILDTARFCSGVTRSYTRKTLEDLCPDLFWIKASGTPASNSVVVPVALTTWLVKLPGILASSIISLTIVWSRFVPTGESQNHGQNGKGLR